MNGDENDILEAEDSFPTSRLSLGSQIVCVVSVSDLTFASGGFERSGG